MTKQKLFSLKQYLASEGLKLTKQRELIVNIFFNQKEHISAEELYALVKVKDPSVGLATVYRTLNLLVQAKIAGERHFGDSASRYEPLKTDKHHDHLICLDCGRIVEFENNRIEKLQQEVAQNNGFDVSHHKLELYGQCKSCKAKKSKAF